MCMETERLVELRDGGVVLMRLPTHEFRMSDDRTLALEQCERLAFAATVPKDADEIMGWLEALGADRCAERDAASEALLEQGGRHWRLLEHRLRRDRDPERRFRLAQVLAKLPQAAEPAEVDAVRLSDGSERFGSLGDWRVPARMDGAAIELRRDVVARIWDPAVRWDDAATTGGTVEHLAFGEFERLDVPLRIIDFETDDRGQPIKSGAPLNRAFQRWGCTLATSARNSDVAADTYVVEGRSRGNSASTRNPRWEGTITVTFHEPGRPDSPAGVRVVGCWAAAVQRDGTALQAYDRNGELIGEIRSRRGPCELLALRSRTPIAFARIAPDPAIDANYTIDDLFFDHPRGFGRVQDRRRWRVRTRRGEHIACDALRFDGEQFELRGLPAGLPDLRRTADQVTRIVWPGSVERSAPAASPLLMLADGQTLALAEGVRVRRIDADHVAVGRPGDERDIPLAALEAIDFVHRPPREDSR